MMTHHDMQKNNKSPGGITWKWFRVALMVLLLSLNLQMWMLMNKNKKTKLRALKVQYI